MYEVSEKYREAIRGRSRKFDWYGTITTPAGRVYHFTSKDIVKGSGTLTRSCSGSTSLELGSVYAAELDIGDEFATAREILLKNMDGNCAWRSGH